MTPAKWSFAVSCVVFTLMLVFPPCKVKVRVSNPKAEGYTASEPIRERNTGEVVFSEPDPPPATVLVDRRGYYCVFVQGPEHIEFKLLAYQLIILALVTGTTTFVLANLYRKEK